MYACKIGIAFGSLRRKTCDKDGLDGYFEDTIKN
jgi:hypothetical protein